MADTLLDRCWLWGMKPNILQEAMPGFSQYGNSRMTVEDAIQRTGVTNVIMAGGLPIDDTSLAAMPTAKQIICKWSLHHGEVIDEERCHAALIGAKALAAHDTRIDGFHIDDFSTGSINAGAAPEHLSRLLFANALHAPRLPVSATIYTMSLERPELPALLPYFDQYLVPLWHADQIETVPAALDRLSALSGGKPAMLCLYVYDFGNDRLLPGNLMQRHLDVAERLLLEQKVVGMCVCGTCMMDLDWEANWVLFDWYNKAGSVAYA